MRVYRVGNSILNAAIPGLSENYSVQIQGASTKDEDQS